jgi:hypothetical protein
MNLLASKQKHIYGAGWDLKTECRRNSQQTSSTFFPRSQLQTSASQIKETNVSGARLRIIAHHVGRCQHLFVAPELPQRLFTFFSSPQRALELPCVCRPGILNALQKTPKKMFPLEYAQTKELTRKQQGGRGQQYEQQIQRM